MDKEFALLLDSFEEYLFKYVELSRLLKCPIKESIIVYYKDLRDRFNKLESLSVKAHFSTCQSKENIKHKEYDVSTEGFNIMFDDDINKPPCENCKCIIF